MARRHVMTPKRLAALKKAQRESALKRKHGKHYAKRGSSRRKTIRRNRKIGRAALMAYNTVQIAGGAAALAYGLHDIHKSNQAMKRARNHVHKNKNSSSKQTATRHGKGRSSGPPRSNHPYVSATRRRFRR